MQVRLVVDITVPDGTDPLQLATSVRTALTAATDALEITSCDAVVPATGAPTMLTAGTWTCPIDGLPVDQVTGSFSTGPALLLQPCGHTAYANGDGSLRASG